MSDDPGEGCNWPVGGVRRCRRDGSPFLADLVVCWQHERMFLEALAGAIRWPQDRHDEAMQGVARQALGDIAHAELVEREAGRRAKSLVYFVEREGFVKIGYTSDLKKRVRDISRGSCLAEGMTVGPVTLLATIEGAGRSSELWLHKRFAHLCVGGEWFLPDDELSGFIANLKSSTTRTPERTAA